MPIIKSAIKRMHQTVKRRARNVTAKRNMRTAVKEFDTSKTTETLSKAHSEIDKAVKKNIISKNAAARKKSQLVKVAKKATEAKPAVVKKATAKPAAKKPVAAKAAPKKVAAKKAE